MSDNAVISHNVSTDTYGGGGGVFNFNGTFTMNGGSINNNKAPKGGGGVENYAENNYKIIFTTPSPIKISSLKLCESKYFSMRIFYCCLKNKTKQNKTFHYKLNS